MNIGKKIGICAHSYEGGALCFLSTCKEGAQILGAHYHPTIILSAVPMGLSMPAYETNNHDEVGKYLREGVDRVAKAGADFFICPDNTAHIILEKIISTLPIPGLHIADVVCKEIIDNGWKRVGLLGTNWTMTGPVYSQTLKEKNLIKQIPDDSTREEIHKAIFEELCQGIFRKETIAMFQNAIENLKNKGAECVILGCTEIPLIITPENSALPIVDSTRLLAKYAVRHALSENNSGDVGWIRII